MDDEFVIVSADGDPTLSFEGPVPSGLGPDDGAEFLARLVGGPVSASVHVYDLQPHAWSSLFRELADNWRGWQGAKSLCSLEGNLSLACTADRTGHVAIRVRLTGMRMADDWFAEDTIWLEAGQLEAIALRAERFFGKP